MTPPIADQDLLNLTEEQVREIFAQGEEAVTWVVLQLVALAKGKTAAEVSKPSSQVAPYEKPAAKKRPKKRGQKKGHKGVRRAPLEIDKEEEHTLACCPDCGGPVSAPRGKRQRVVEDIEKTTVVTTAHTIHSHYCPQCKKRVEPVVTDALPKSTIGNRALVLAERRRLDPGHARRPLGASHRAHGPSLCGPDVDTGGRGNRRSRGLGLRNLGRRFLHRRPRDPVPSRRAKPLERVSLILPRGCIVRGKYGGSSWPGFRK